MKVTEKELDKLKWNIEATKDRRGPKMVMRIKLPPAHTLCLSDGDDDDEDDNDDYDEDGDKDGKDNNTTTQ